MPRNWWGSTVWVERSRIRKPDAEASRVGEREVGFPGLREVGEDLEAVAEIDDEKERRVGLVGGKRPGVALGLATGFEHGVVPRAASSDGSRFFLGCKDPGFLRDDRERGLFFFRSGELLRFEHEAGAAIEVDAALGAGAVTARDADRELERIAVRVGVRRTLDTELVGQFDQKLLGIRALGRFRLGPAGDKGFGGGGHRKPKASGHRPD